MITLSGKTGTTFSDIPTLMIGDNCLVNSPQLFVIQNVRSIFVGIAKLNLFNSLCFAVGCLLSGQVGPKLATLVQLVKSGLSW